MESSVSLRSACSLKLIRIRTLKPESKFLEQPPLVPQVWRRGESSFRYILGQAVIAAILLWNSYQGYLLTKKIFPNTIYAAISAAMLCFYSYVVISGGNPPPKKLRTQV